MHPAAPGGRRRSLLIAAVIMALFLAGALSSAMQRGLSRGFDELAHLSYVAEVQASGIVPLERLRTLDPVDFRFTPTANYLNHPAPYYALLAAVGPTIEGNPGALLWHRLINLSFGAAGLGLLLAASLAMARDQEEALVALVALGCIPTLAPLAGLVNNDNLGLLGGALMLFGLERFLRNRRNRDLALAGAGLAIAGAAKLTALMLCGGAFVLVLLFAARLRRPRPAHLAIVAAALLLAALAPLDLMLSYGSPAPDTVAQHALLVDGARIAGWDRAPRLGPAAYVWDFLRQFIASWRPHYDEVTALQSAMRLLPLLTLAVAAAGTVLAAREVLARRADPAALIVTAGAAAILATFAVHLGFSYQRHLATGWRLDAYARYYLPLAAIVPWACWMVLRRLRPPARSGLAAFLVAAPILFGLLG